MKWGFSCIVSTLLFLSISSPVDAYRLVDADEVKLDIGVWAQAGYAVSGAEGERLEYGPYLGLARLSTRATHVPYGTAIVQIDASKGGVQLVDAVAKIHPTDALELRMGRFKLPTSRDVLISAPETPFVNRSLLVSFVPSRLIGAEVVGKLKSDVIAVTVQGGMFQPGPAVAPLLTDGGAFASARTILDLSFGLSFHLAYLALVLTDNAEVPLTDDPAGPIGRPVDYPEAADLGLTFVRDGWTVFVEGLVAPLPDGGADWGTYAHVLHAFDVFESFQLEPGARYDLMERSGVLTHRVTTGLTFYIVGSHLNVLTNYEVTFSDHGQSVHAGYLQFQAGL